MANKIRYEVDPYNRLVEVDKKLPIPKQRRVLDGVFALGKGNSLEYRVKSPTGASDITPHQVKLKGSWSLTKEHNLKLSLDKSAGVASGDTLTIEGDIIDINGNALLFSVTTKRSESIRTTYVLELEGAWQADRNNRLIFKVKREGGNQDRLAFEGAWDVGKNNEIIYSYEKSHLKRKLKVEHTLVLKGQWNIGDKGFVKYEAGVKSNSVLNFKTSLGICGESFIKYEIGVKVSGRMKPVVRTVTLFGIWRLKRGASLFFDIECEDGNTYSLAFTAEVRLTKTDTISIRLKNDAGAKDLELSFELNHALLGGDGNLFLRALRSRGETGIIVGAGFNW